MNIKLRNDAEQIARTAIAEMSPDSAIKRALKNKKFSGRIFLISVGKAGWQMAKSAVECMEQEIYKGLVVTKYNHVLEEIPNVTCYEAGHPVPDENSFLGTQAVLEATADLNEDDTVLFLLSGGGSALFETPLVSGEELQNITKQLLHSGADIKEMNTIRKRLSKVKGGRFAQWCAPAKVEAIILSDIVGDPLDMIASGPTVADASTCQQAMEIAEKYNLSISEKAKELLQQETPKEILNVHTSVIGSVRELCEAAARECKRMGYEAIILTDCLECEAKDAGIFLADILKAHKDEKGIAYIAGGETVVHVSGDGLGGRNQEFALAAAATLSGMDNLALISVGSDGTDGPTDAAGGYVDGDTYSSLQKAGYDYDAIMTNHDAYHGLKAVDGLIITGPTGTNVNDVAIGLISKEE
ncbi:MAG: glycerate kinase [Agathobacter sp.]|nr:glycerate kinase [Agathobacter sp.]